MNKLFQLRQLTTIVADTSQISKIKNFSPQDATTNPSLIYEAVQIKEYQYLLSKAIKKNKNLKESGKKILQRIINDLLVYFGKEILDNVPGRVSTEVDARLAFDVEGTIEKARYIIHLYEEINIPRERILIKIPATWEGIQAAKVITKQNIQCNMTLVFSLAQAIACADVNVQMISPFVGRIMDWHALKTGKKYEGYKDPGVLFVKSIFNYYKKYNYKTEIMGASFRNTNEILELAGCDLLTISPKLLKELMHSKGLVEEKLNCKKAKLMKIEKIEMNEKIFRWTLNEEIMASEKLSEGIRNFAKDIVKLEKQIISLM